MGVLDESEAILVAKVDPPGVTGLATWLGRRMEAHISMKLSMRWSTVRSGHSKSA
jgi:hypothetical protein